MLSTALAACQRHEPASGSDSTTSVLGNSGFAPSASGGGTRSPTSARERRAGALPPAPAPSGTGVQVTMADSKTGLALWLQDGRVMVSRWTLNTNWERPKPLETIAGSASHARLASNGRGVAIAVWQHTVGDIESLRYSRWQHGRGWETPDVMPGALPRPHDEGGPLDTTAVRIEVDRDGNARAEWPSGFDADQMQSSTFVPGEGWARPVDLPLQAAAPPMPAGSSTAQR